MSQHDEVRCADAEDADYGSPIFEHDTAPSSEDEDEISSEEDDYNNDEDNKQAIYESVTACLELFSQFTGQADLSDTSAKSEEIDDERPRERAEFIKDMERSFNLWIDYTGALAADINRSLDVRLQGYKDIKGMSVELLEMLARNLEYLEKTEKRDPNSLTDNQLQNEAINSIRHAVEELHFMASVIRRSSVRSQNYSLSSGFKRDDDSYFENYAFLIIRHTFPHARRSLCKQLGASIALRRKRLRRNIQHEEKLKTRRTPGQVSTNPGQAIHNAQSQPSWPQPGLPPMSHSSPPQVNGPVKSTRSIDTRSNLNAGMARRGFKEKAALSTISMGSSVRMSERKYPPKPHFQPGATDCACPYCARRLATIKLSNTSTFWEDHLDEDVQPYICLSEECTSPLLFFVHMKQWADHMNLVHSDQWTRRIHMSTWYCDTDHNAEQFNDLESFMQHMKNPANHPGRPPPSDLQLDTLSRNKQKTLTREDEYSCPFCDCIPDTLKPVILTSEPKAIRHQLHKHIASHIKNLAVLSIPVLTTPETPKSESNESKDEEKGRRLKDDEEASYPSGYDEELHAIILFDNENPGGMPPLDISETQDTHWHDVGFIEWYESEKARLNTLGPKIDVVLQDFIRVQGGGGMTKRFNPSDFTIGWVCALPIELAAAAEIMDTEYTDHGRQPILLPSDTNNYTYGSIEGHLVVVACLPSGLIGTNSAAIVASRMHNSFPALRFSLLVGIGGGVPTDENDIRLGDVVVSQPTGDHNGVIQFGFGRTGPGGRIARTGSLNAPPVVLLSALSTLKSNYFRGKTQFPEYLAKLSNNPIFISPGPLEDTLYKASSQHVPGSTCAKCDPEDVVKRDPRRTTKPLLFFGNIASGDQVMKDAPTRDQHSRDLGGVLCFEMEAAGLMNTFPCIVIRGICDYADAHKNKKWQPYAAATAAACAKELLHTIQPLQVARAHKSY